MAENNEYTENAPAAENAKKKNEENEGIAGFVYDVVYMLAFAMVMVALCFILFFRTVSVDGSSMYPTLHDKDRILLTAYYPEPKYGDIVVTCRPSDVMPDTLIKRVIAVGGQTVDMDFEQGIVYVDGVALDEPYINRPFTDREDFKGEITVPEGYVFIMGDNRNESTDSRDNRVGFMPEDYIMGKALIRLSPWGQFKIGK